MDLDDSFDASISASVDEFLVTRPSLPTARRVAVFGSSRSGIPPALFAEVEALGRRLAEDRWTILNGGYGGVMQAISKGARDAGGEVVAVTAEFNPDEHPNPYFRYEVRHGDLLRRMRYFIETADAYVVLPGGVGTLAELSLAWAHKKSQSWGSPPLLAWQDPWQDIVFGLEASSGFWRPDLQMLTWVRGAEDTARILGEQVTAGHALRLYEDTTPSRRRALEAYLASNHKDVRATFATLEPIVMRPTGEVLTRAEVLALATALLRLQGDELEDFDDLPYEDVVRTRDDAWASEFVDPIHGTTHVLCRSRSLHLAGESVWLQEFESLHFRDRPEPLAPGRGDRVLRVVNLSRGWMVAAQCETGAQVAVSAASPQRSRELLEYVESCLQP